MSELMNLVGLGTGVVLYTMLLAMVLRRGARSAAVAGVDPLLLATGILGLVWNVCALPTYELPKLGFHPFAPLTVLGFASLGFLPAVVVQSVLRDEHDRLDGRSKRAIALVAYGVSGAAAAMHLAALASGNEVPSPAAMRLLTYSFIVLALPVAAVTRRQAGGRRALWVAALAIFAVSALHLSQAHRGDGSWPIELLGHHASVPLAVAILYQDYPFALADLFLKRALTLLVLIAAAFASVTGLHTTLAGAPLGGAREVASLVVLWVVTAVLYPRLRDGISWFVDGVILHRPDYSRIVATVAARARAEQDIAAMLDVACRELAPAFSARTVAWRELANGDAPGSRHGALSTVIEIPVTETPQYVITVADLTGGRRLLSDDHAALQSIAAVLGRRIDAIRLTRERYARQLREHEMGKLATEAELRALRSQINPHFLFNALTTIGYLIQTAPERAFETLMRLTALLRGVLRSEGEFTTVERELSIVEAYLDIERARYEHRLSVRIDVPEDVRRLRIPPLLLQPIVENAVKHGIAPQREGGEVRVSGRLEDVGDGGAVLILTVRDSGVGVSNTDLQRRRGEGVGLSNVERRLTAHYGATSSLAIATALGVGTTVELRLPAERMVTGTRGVLAGRRRVS